MSWKDLLPAFGGLTLRAIQCDADGITVDLVSTSQHAACTTCNTMSGAGHGWFTRRVQELPVAGRSTHLHICGRRFRCLNPACPRTTFREDLSAIVPRYQRRTPEVTHLFRGFGCEAGGNAGVRLATLLRLHTSRSTLLRATLQGHRSDDTAPQVVGVDEFAWKKGRRYGTILVDLEAHQVLALLPDREVATVAAWFRAHPSVQFVTRDRSGAFAEAIRLGAPHATQIADRFHLAMNATTCLEAIVTREHSHLRRIIQELREQRRADLPPAVPTPYYHQRESQDRRTRRHGRYEQAISLHQQGWSNSAIARELGMHRDTIARYLKAKHFPERMNRPARPKAVDRYLAHLQRRWSEGEHNGRRLHQELRAMGYRGGTTMVYTVIRPWRKLSLGSHHVCIARTWPFYSPRQTTWLLLKSEDATQTPEQQTYVQAVLHCPADIAIAFPLIQRFRRLLSERDASRLGQWAREAAQSGIPELVSFVQGLYRDWKAVTNSLVFAYSQGQVEGSVNRVKLLKRQGYGRASPALLQARVMGARDLYPN